MCLLENLFANYFEIAILFMSIPVHAMSIKLIACEKIGQFLLKFLRRNCCLQSAIKHSVLAGYCY